MSPRTRVIVEQAAVRRRSAGAAGEGRAQPREIARARARHGAR
jgi:hypothetical protein